jgi:hypothetical protein
MLRRARDCDKSETEVSVSWNKMTNLHTNDVSRSFDLVRIMLAKIGSFACAYVSMPFGLI